MSAREDLTENIKATKTKCDSRWKDDHSKIDWFGLKLPDSARRRSFVPVNVWTGGRSRCHVIKPLKWRKANGYIYDEPRINCITVTPLLFPYYQTFWWCGGDLNSPYFTQSVSPSERLALGRKFVWKGYSVCPFKRNINYSPHTPQTHYRTLFGLRATYHDRIASHPSRLITTRPGTVVSSFLCVWRVACSRYLRTFYLHPLGRAPGNRVTQKVKRRFGFIFDLFL